MVDARQWGLALSRYVHLNPVRVKEYQLDKPARQRNRAGVGPEVAGEVFEQRLRELRNYRWSSYRAYIGWEPQPAWLVCTEILNWMPPGKSKPASAYQKYVEEGLREGLGQSPWDNLQGQVVLGDEDFVRQIQDAIQGDVREQRSLQKLKPRPSFSEVVTVVEQLKGEPWQQFVNRPKDWGRDLALDLGRTRGGLKLKQLGALVGMDYASVGMALKRFSQWKLRDEKLAATIKQANDLLDVDSAAKPPALRG